MPTRSDAEGHSYNLDLEEIRRCHHVAKELRGPGYTKETSHSSNIREISTTSIEGLKPKLYVAAFQDRLIDYSQDHAVTSALDKVFTHLEKELPKVFCKPGHLVRVGSCQDDSKVGRVNELDTLYVINEDLLSEPTDDGYNVCNKHDKTGTQIRPLDLIEKFADAVETVICSYKKLPPPLEHGGYSWQETTEDLQFCGVRYNGPAVTLQFINKEEKTYLSVDITVAFSLPTDLNYVREHVERRLRPVQETVSNKLLDCRNLCLVPDVIHNVWMVCTGQLEANILRDLSPDAPAKRAYAYSKIIKYDLTKENKDALPGRVPTETNHSTPLNVDNFMPDIVDYINKWQNTDTQLPYINKALRYAHIFLSGEQTTKFHETSKPLVAINTAALKHIILNRAFEIPSAFREVKDDDNERTEDILQHVFYYLALSTEVSHALLGREGSAIKTFTYSGHAAARYDLGSLEAVIQKQCQMIYQKLKTPEKLSHLETQHTVDMNLIDFTDCNPKPGPEYSFTIPTNFLVPPHKSSSAVSAVLIIIALLNACGGILLLTGEQQQKKILECWLKRFKAFLIKYLPENTQKVCMDVEYKGWGLSLTVQASKHLIFYKSFCYVSSDADIVQVSTLEELDLRQTTTSSYVLEGSYKYDTQICPMPNTVFKYLDVSTVEELVQHLKCEEFVCSILAMFNMASGGQVILGVENESGKIKGQIINSDDEQRLEAAVEEAISSCSVAIWGKKKKVPTATLR